MYVCLFIIQQHTEYQLCLVMLVIKNQKNIDLISLFLLVWLFEATDQSIKITKNNKNNLANCD